MSEVSKQTPYYEGVLDVYYATIKTPGDATNPPEYDTPAVMGHTMEVIITPRFKEGKVYASNVLQRYRKTVDGYDVKVKADQVLPAVRRALLGRKTDANGVEMSTGSDDAPEVAIGFALTLDDGSNELWWLLRGKFSESDTSAKTQEDKYEYQHPTYSGRFDRRVNDNLLYYVVNTAELGEDKAAVAENWFKTVYAGAAAQAAATT